MVDTLLHEHVPLPPSLVQKADVPRLSHIVWGPHDGNFQALWDELRTEYQTLRMSGYKGQGFLSKGRVLGARRIHDEELRRQTRVSAVKRTKPSYDGQGRSLDGARLPRGVDMRPVVADAASKSGGITNGCASGTKDGQRLADDAWRNGFRTLAEEDDANEAAIAVALVELYEADRARRLMEETTTSGYHDGLVWSIESGLQPAGGDGANDLPGGSPALGSVAARAPPIEWNDAVWETIYDDVWSCPICTLDNTEQHLACDACGSERPTYISSRKPSTAKIDADSRVSGGEIASSGAHGKLYRWNCQGCGEFMESKRWACSRCGTMNPSS